MTRRGFRRSDRVWINGVSFQDVQPVWEELGDVLRTGYGSILECHFNEQSNPKTSAHIAP